ncbi:MAG: hypothetical protein LBK95_12120 [Bifidobacteriaceae bacterium]|jgi:shikimate dehydrogenase|nr:hypothetical protein [Bifidobacteriaceae bacterium]
MTNRQPSPRLDRPPNRELKRAAVLGSPIAHSLSPALHRAGYQALGLENWAYEAIEMTSERLPDWLASLGPEWKGLSLTMPLKRTVLELVDHVQPLARMAGGANTVLFTPAGTVGANTDVHGIVAAVREVAPERQFRSATVLGGGATAASALAALAELDLRNPRVYVRSTARSRPMLEAAARMGVEPQLRKLRDDRPPIDWPADLTISTLPSHAADALAQDLAIGLSPSATARLAPITAASSGPMAAARPAPSATAHTALSTATKGVASSAMNPAVSPVTSNGVDPVASLAANPNTLAPGPPVLLDAAYDPWPSALAEAWAEAGGTVVSGKTMLLHQAAAQFQLMTGIAAPLEQMRAAIT